MQQLNKLAKMKKMNSQVTHSKAKNQKHPHNFGFYRKKAILLFVKYTSANSRKYLQLKIDIWEITPWSTEVRDNQLFLEFFGIFNNKKALVLVTNLAHLILLLTTSADNEALDTCMHVQFTWQNYVTSIMLSQSNNKTWIMCHQEQKLNQKT